MEWINKYLRISPEKILKTKKFVKGKELWVSSLCWLPFIGDVIAVVLGLLRTNFIKTSIGMLIGKGLRYMVWAIITFEIKAIIFSS